MFIKFIEAKNSGRQKQIESILENKNSSHYETNIIELQGDKKLQK